MNRTLAAIAITVGLAVAAPSGDALARSEKVLTWDLGTLFPTAVRFLRIDMGVRPGGFVAAGSIVSV